MEGVVIDTNVFAAALFNPRSASARILEGIREGRFRLIWNQPTRRETEMILRRIPRLDWQKVAALFRPAFPAIPRWQDDLRTRSAGVVTPEDVTEVDRALVAFVTEHCNSRPIVIDSAADRLLPSPRIWRINNAPSRNRQSGAVARSHARVFFRRRPLDARPL
jgi:hypothetical protein